MNLIHIIHSIDNPATGPSNSVGGLCRALQARGQTIRLATLDWEPLKEHDSFILRFPAGWGPRRLGASPKLYEWLRAQAADGADLVMHGHNMWMMTGIYPSRVRRKFPDTRLVFSPRGALSTYSLSIGSRVKPLFWSALMRPALMAADCLHATSVAEAQDMLQLGLHRPIAIIPNVVEMPSETLRPAQDTRIAMYLGRLHPEKGLETLLDAWASLGPEHDGWKLHLVGPDPVGYRTVLEAKVAELGLQSVVFMDAVAGQKKWQALSQAEFLVLPSPSENFGMVVAEALACAVPVATTKGTPWAELPKKGAGWYCEATVGGIASAIGQAMATPWAERRAMGARGRAWIQAEFGRSTIVERYEQTYQWVRTGGAPPPWIEVAHVK